MKCKYCKSDIIDDGILPYVPSPVFAQSVSSVLYSGETYHKSCFDVLLKVGKIQDQRIEISLNLKISEIIETLSKLPAGFSISKKLSLTLAEHNHDYILCAGCKKLISRKIAIVGERTKFALTPKHNKVEKDGLSHSKPRKVFYFCSQFCDMHFANVVINLITNEIKLGIIAVKEAENYFSHFVEVYSAGKDERSIAVIKDALGKQKKARQQAAQVKVLKNVQGIIDKYNGFKVEVEVEEKEKAEEE